jgi:hypothetical protein
MAYAARKSRSSLAPGAAQHGQAASASRGPLVARSISQSTEPRRPQMSRQPVSSESSPPAVQRPSTVMGPPLVLGDSMGEHGDLAGVLYPGGAEGGVVMVAPPQADVALGGGRAARVGFVEALQGGIRRGHERLRGPGGR